jgi:hypothetical protein
MEPTGLIFVGMGASLLAIGLFFFFRTRSFLARAVRVTGTVLDFEVSSGSEGTTYQPVVSYATREGETCRFTDSVATSPPGFSVGESVPVAYDPANPTQAKLLKPFRLWFVAGLLSSMGVLFVVIGVVIALVVGAEEPAPTPPPPEPPREPR